jgi:hypothetical protein
MSVGSVQVKILRGASASHTGYARQRRRTPPGSSSSNSAPERASDPVDGAASSTKPAASAFGFCLARGRPEAASAASNRFRHARKLRLEVFLARQNPASDWPLASNCFTNARHSDAVRRIRPSDRTRIRFLLVSTKEDLRDHHTEEKDVVP